MIIDLHTHTKNGSPCSYVEPDKLIQQAKLLGLDGICFTEHNQLWDTKALEKLRIKHDFLVLGGIEATIDDGGQVLAFGLHQHGPWLSIYRLKDLRQAVDEVGGIIIAAHPFRGYSPSFYSTCHPGSPEFDDACQNPILKLVDAMETHNGHGAFSQHSFSTEVASHLNLKATGGSDAHAAPELGTCFTIFENKIRNEQELIAELKRGKYRAAASYNGKLSSRNNGDNHRKEL